MNRILSSVKSHAPALLLFLYLFSFWILPQDWSETNELDGSWRYALGRFRGLGFALGRDSWFTYGPLAHWFGAPMGPEHFQPFPYYILGLFVAVVIGISFARILIAIGLPFRVGVIATLIFPFCFIGMEGSAEIQIIIALFLLLTCCCLEEKPGRFSIFSMILLSGCGLVYKISLGILSLFMLLVLLVSCYVGKRISGRLMMFCLAGYLALLYVLFVVTSGSFDLVRYIVLGLETSSKYSEIMIRNLSYSPPNYIIALAYGAAGSVPAWLASKKMAGRGAMLCLILAFSGTMLILFKHGFVRADLSHMRLFYGSVTPVLAILALISCTGFKAKVTSEKVLLCSASLILVVIYALMLKFLPGDNNPVNLVKNWLTCGNRMVAGIQGQSGDEYPAKRAAIKNSHPQLFSWLNEHGRTFGAKGRKPRITFYPWELMFFEGLEGFDLAPSPSLQLYSTGPHSRAHRLEAEFLSSVHCPDIVVIGPGAIDDRSPVSELTDLLPPLHSHYRVIAVVDGFTVFEASVAGNSPERVIRYSETPQGISGEFLSISFDQQEAVNKLFWPVAATLFKSPQLKVVVTMTNSSNEKAEYVWSGYLSQLQGGVFFSPDSIPEFFGLTSGISAKMPNPSPANPTTIKSARAEVRRSGGFWNLPVFPQVVPLKVKYCSFR